MKKNIKGIQTGNPNKPDYKGRKNTETGDEAEGYPEYPPEEDIYKQYHHEIELNPEEPVKPKEFNIPDDAGEADSAVQLPGDDLDIPGAELDDEQESIGTEDEENNYYSLGGDNHEDLEENNDE